jgi:hypothetical protein
MPLKSFNCARCRMKFRIGQPVGAHAEQHIEKSRCPDCHKTFSHCGHVNDKGESIVVVWMDAHPAELSS